jgi:hypothetical protein
VLVASGRFADDGLGDEEPRTDQREAAVSFIGLLAGRVCGRRPRFLHQHGALSCPSPRLLGANEQ